MSDCPAISVVINTDGRVRSLEVALKSLRYLNYPKFEVCVVYGPTPDGTAELLESWRSQIKVAACPEKNLSMSRNIGIALAAGDIVAFIDDDAIPEPEWLNEIAEAFRAPDVGGCGGYALDPSGTEYQWRFGTLNRLGTADESWTYPPVEFSFPYTENFASLMGVNSAFRKSAVLSVGGFDEQYAYFLDESDLIVRLTDCGWKIVPIAGARVHHKFAASSMRDDYDRRKRRATYKAWYSLVKSKIYFSLVNSHGHHGVKEAAVATNTFIEQLRASLAADISLGVQGAHDEKRFQIEVDRGLKDGLKAGLARDRKLFDFGHLREFKEQFILFPTLTPAGGRKTLCVLSKAYQPAPLRCIDRYMFQLATSLARQGHQIHVLTSAQEFDTVDFEEGVWVHRIVPDRPVNPSQRGPLIVPDHIWDYSTTMLSEARKIAEFRQIDAVLAPILDCEGIAFALEGSFPLVSLQMMFKRDIDGRKHHKGGQVLVAKFITRKVPLGSDAVVIDDKTTIETIDRDDRIAIGLGQLGQTAHGSDDWAKLPYQLPEPLPRGAVRVVFVGRLEEQNGIDVFLEAAKLILRANPNVYIDIVGNDTIVGTSHMTYQERFDADQGADSVRDRVSFHGEVSDAALRGYYQACDFFVAPRLESFDSLLLEAMMFGKPVVGYKTDGVSGLARHGVTCLLAEPGNMASLSACMQELIDKPQLRALMGQVARHEYGTEFAPAVVAHKLLEVIAGLPVREPALQARAAKSSVGSVEDDMTAAVTVAKYSAAVSMRRIVIIHSILARHDALSASVYDTYQILAANPTFQVSVFAHRNDFADVPSVFVRDVADLLLHPDYLAADLIIWHFGVCYSLFDAILMGNGKARKIVVFHNITPKQFVPEWLAPLIDQSFRQAHLLRSADEVWNVSPINAETARAFGVADDRVSVVPLVVDAPANSALAEKSRTPVQMIFVGRIVKIKGVLDLIDAVVRLRRRGVPAFRLRLTGNEFSDPDYVSMVRTAIDDYGLSDDVQWLGTVDDRTLFELYHAAHILAIPSYHEGFCKPVVEGLRAGCIPVGYASYNLPYVANKLGRLVPTGDIAALTDALADILEALGGALAMPMERRLPLDCGLLSVSEFDEAARNYVRNFTRAEVSRTVISRVDKLLDVNPSNRDSAASKNYSSGVGELFGV